MQDQPKNPNKNTDKIVLELLNKVEEKKKQIGNAERPAWVTNCSFKYDVNSNFAINLQTAPAVEELVKIHAFLRDKHESYHTSLTQLGLLSKEFSFKYLGFSFF